MLFSDTRKKRDTLFFLFILILSVIILFLPDTINSEVSNTHKIKARVVAVDNSEVAQFGIVKTGDQSLVLEVLSGQFKGIIIEANNILMGKLELDKIFIKDDTVFALLSLDKDGGIIHTSVIDHYRINIELFLFLLFVILLIVYSGWTGLRAILSFIFTGLMIWKVMIPGFLAGYSPIILTNIIVVIFTGVIIFIIAGFNRTGLNAFISSISGVFITTFLAITFGKIFKVHGAVKPFTEMLLYSGYANLNITDIFISGIFLASSGAVMDISMDISASMKEVIDKKPEIMRKELFMSGIRVGRAVVGTMTTTLLLAYSGGFTGLLMVFIAQGTPAFNILNMNYVAAEILHTLVGSFGLVTVAPLTALIGSFILKNKYTLKKDN